MLGFFLKVLDLLGFFLKVLDYTESQKAEYPGEGHVYLTCVL